MSELEGGSMSLSENEAGAGRLLRQARESAGMSLEVLASSLKVPVQKLQALESDDWQGLPDLVFGRALALSVCRVLHLDPAPVLAVLPKTDGARLPSNPEGINTPFKEKALRSSMPTGGSATHLWKIAALLVIAAAGVAALYWLPGWDDKAAPAPASQQEPAAQSLQTPAPAELPAAPTSDAPQLMTPALPALPTEPVAAIGTAGAAAAGAAPQETAAVVAAPETAAAGAAALRIQAKSATWVQIRDAQRRVVMEKTLQPGEIYETSAARPLAVVIGKADSATVVIEGAAFDLAPVVRNNVARFEVK